MPLLVSIARGDRPLSHDTLDEHASRYSTEQLRSLLVITGALPARDEHLARLQRFADRLPSSVDDPDHQRLLAAFGRWDILARLRRRYPDNPVPANAAHRCRAELTAARFLQFLRTRARTLGSCQQTEIDAWFTDQPPHIRTASRAFLTWTRRQHQLDGALSQPTLHHEQPKHFTRADHRWALARRLLHGDTSAAIPDRVAACLVLLYAQPVTRIAALTRDHLKVTVAGTVGLQLGAAEIEVLPELGKPLAQLPHEPPRGAGRNLTDPRWLFPSRRPGQPMHPHTISRRVRVLGVDPRLDRNSALLELARELPPTILGKLLGLHPGTAAWATTAGSNWARYAPRRHARH